MLSEKDKALLVKLFFMNKEATVSLLKLRLQKNVKTGKGPSTVVLLIKPVQRLEEAGSLEDRVKSERPTLKTLADIVSLHGLLCLQI
ncbi:hypothetical protein TNCV_1807991 [Trichonephila clavipes]|nr:hypothetical protein TNCV_1807991 [Trichonephila clavipes]